MQWSWTPKHSCIPDQREEKNWQPLSDVISCRSPNQATQPEKSRGTLIGRNTWQWKSLWPSHSMIHCGNQVIGTLANWKGADQSKINMRHLSIQNLNLFGWSADMRAPYRIDKQDFLYTSGKYCTAYHAT